MTQTKRPPYKHQAWPAMRYHPETGAHIICETAKDVPDGYVDSLSKVGSEEPAPSVTLESFDLTRKEALAMLAEADVEHAGNASNAKLAALMQQVLDDDDSE